MPVTKVKFYQKEKFKDNLWGYIFIMPNLLGFLVFTLGGIVFSLVMSFTDWNFLKDMSTANFIGIDNFLSMPSDAWFRSSIFNNFWLLLAVPIQVLLAMFLANVIHTNVFGKGPVRAMLYLPYVTNLVAVSTVWLTLFHPSSGPINNLLKAFGIQNAPMWLADVHWVKPALVIIIVWQAIGYYVLLYSAALQNIPAELYEAAEVDGAGKFRQFVNITIPLLSPTTFLVVILSLISSLQSWTLIQILTNGGPGTSSYVLGLYIFLSAFKYFRMGYASALSWVMFVIVFIITMIQWYGQKKWVNY